MGSYEFIYAFIVCALAAFLMYLFCLILGD